MRPITDIRKRDVIELIEDSPVQATRALAYVRRLLNWAAGRDIIEANPAQFVEKPVRERKRERWLDDAELAKVWREGCTLPFRDGLRLLILTGARRDEIFGLQWLEVDLEAQLSGSRQSAPRVPKGARSRCRNRHWTS